MADVRVTLNNPLPSSGSSAIDRIEYRLDLGGGAGGGVVDALTTTPTTFDIPDGEGRWVELRQWNQTLASEWSPAQRALAPTPPGPAVNPVITDATFTPGAAGTPSTVDLIVTYTGADTLTVYVATGDATLSITAAQLIAGAGGTGALEYTDYAYVYPADVNDLSGLTSTSDPAVRMAFVVVEDTNAGESNVELLTVSNIDYTVPTFDGANSTPADGGTMAPTGSIVLDFSEDIFAGTGDFYLYKTTGAVLVETFDSATGTGDAGGTITFATDKATITPNAARVASTAYNIQWSAGAVIDAKGNALAANATETAYNFTTTGSFTENAIAGATDRYLDASDVMPNSDAILLFASYTATTNGRNRLVSWDGANGEFRSDTSGTVANELSPGIIVGSGATDLGAGVNTAAVVANGLNTRVHVLASAESIFDGAEYAVTVKVAVWDETNGWTESTNSTGDNILNTPLYLSAANTRVLDRSDSTGTGFVGTLHRVAAWPMATGELPDIFLAATKADFTSAGSIVDPAISQAEYGQALIDLSGTAAQWNAGTHDGSAALTAYGSDFTDV